MVAEIRSQRIRQRKKHIRLALAKTARCYILFFAVMPLLHLLVAYHCRYVAPYVDMPLHSTVRSERTGRHACYSPEYHMLHALPLSPSLHASPPPCPRTPYRRDVATINEVLFWRPATTACHEAPYWFIQNFRCSYKSIRMSAIMLASPAPRNAISVFRFIHKLSPKHIMFSLCPQHDTLPLLPYSFSPSKDRHASAISPRNNTPVPSRNATEIPRPRRSSLENRRSRCHHPLVIIGNGAPVYPYLRHVYIFAAVTTLRDRRSTPSCPYLLR